MNCLNLAHITFSFRIFVQMSLQVRRCCLLQKTEPGQLECWHFASWLLLGTPWVVLDLRMSLTRRMFGCMVPRSSAELRRRMSGYKGPQSSFGWRRILAPRSGSDWWSKSGLAQTVRASAEWGQGQRAAHCSSGRDTPGSAGEQCPGPGRESSLCGLGRAERSTTFSPLSSESLKVMILRAASFVAYW